MNSPIWKNGDDFHILSALFEKKDNMIKIYSFQNRCTFISNTFLSLISSEDID
jgi:hypothetical protein